MPVGSAAPSSSICARIAPSIPPSFRDEDAPAAAAGGAERPSHDWWRGHATVFV
ncbi:MAG: hypothetical protein HY744_31455 [Deltaproteobacteria bacterium]|nr:hypothetical protein [Deltaproteobacteria bacterium]